MNHSSAWEIAIVYSAPILRDVSSSSVSVYSSVPTRILFSTHVNIFSFSFERLNLLLVY